MEFTTTSEPHRANAASAGEPRDEDLVHAIRAGDEAAFAALMRRYNRRLFRLCRSVLRNEAEAEDAVQEAYLAAFLKLDGLEDPARIGAWLCRIAWNGSISRVRLLARRAETGFAPEPDGDWAVPAIAESAVADQGDGMMMRSDTRRLLERAIDRLDDVFRPVFMLRGVEEMSVAETAELLDIPADTVKTRYFRGRKALQRILLEDFQVTAQDVFPFAGARCAALAERVLARVKAEGGLPITNDRPGETPKGSCFMSLKRIFAAGVAALAVSACSMEGMMMEQARGPEFQSVAALTSLPEFLPGLGALYVDPATLPAGPFLAYDRGGDLVSTIYMVPLSDMNAQKSFDDLGAPGRDVLSTDLYYNGGHPGVSVPHYHVVLWHVDKSTAELQ